MLKAGWRAQMFTVWSEPKRWIKKGGTQYRQIDVPLGPLDPPKVTNNHIKDGERLAQLEVWAQDGNREVTP
jgi:hypothetical protein